MDHSETSKPTAAASPNRTILDEVNGAAAWFHAKKVRPIWVCRVETQKVVETIEGTETVNAGDYICRGEAGDIWPQSAESLDKKYETTAETSEDGWLKCRPRPDAEGVMAAKVDHPFTIVATWGELSGKRGDYIAKNFDDRDVEYPNDVWIVDGKLFGETYAAVGDDD